MRYTDPVLLDERTLRANRRTRRHDRGRSKATTQAIALQYAAVDFPLLILKTISPTLMKGIAIFGQSFDSKSNSKQT